MNLTEYFKSKGGTGKPSCVELIRMARRIAVAPRTLYMIVRGHKLPGPILCAHIEAYTEGKVSRQDLRPEIFKGIEAIAQPSPDGQGDALVTDAMVEAAHSAYWTHPDDSGEDRPCMRAALEAALAAPPAKGIDFSRFAGALRYAARSADMATDVNVGDQLRELLDLIDNKG